MKQDQQRKLDSLHRTKDFLETHAGTVGALAESAGKHQLDQAVSTLAAFSREQDTANLQIAGFHSREAALVRTLRADYMQPVSIFARARLRGAPDFAALTRPAGHLNPKELVRAARAMATAAAPHVNAMVAGGFAADAVDSLAAAADAVEAAVLERANAKVRRVGATKGVEQQLLAGREAVTMLHAVIRSQHASDPIFLAAWDAARRVTSKMGPARVPAAGGVPTGAPVTPVLVTAA